MNKTLVSMMLALCLGIVACKESSPKTEAECTQSLCTKEHCYVWSAELNRCGTADALKKEEARLKKIAKAAEGKDSVKVSIPKTVRDSIAKIEKREKTIRAEMKYLKNTVDSLRQADSVSGSTLSAVAYLKAKMNAEKDAVEKKYKNLMDSVEVLNLVNHKQVSAVQWIEYNKRKKKARLENLEKKKDKLKQPEKKR